MKTHPKFNVILFQTVRDIEIENVLISKFADKQCDIIFPQQKSARKKTATICKYNNKRLLEGVGVPRVHVNWGVSSGNKFPAIIDISSVLAVHTVRSLVSFYPCKTGSSIP